MKNLMTCLVVCVLSGVALADTWLVDDDGKADFDNIQAAVDAASDGDEIVVMPGTYAGTGDQVVDMLGKAVWLHSQDGADSVILNGQGSRRVLICTNGEDALCIIEGLTISNGYADKGAGIWIENSSPTFVDCIVQDNVVYQFAGAGLYASACQSSVSNCAFRNNTCISTQWSYGGGAYWQSQANMTFTDCTFTNNSARLGGGAWVGSGSLIDCTFESNTSEYSGGGICSNGDISLQITNCTFVENESNSWGGGVYLSAGNGNTELSSCVFIGNGASEGGGLQIISGSITVDNCTFTDNTASSGSGIGIRGGSPTISNCDFVGNNGNVIWRYSSGNPIPIDSCSLRNNEGYALYLYNACFSISNSTICGNLADEQIYGCWFDEGGNDITDVCDDDSDGIPDDEDNCPLYNPDQADCNDNGIGDICDIDNGISDDINSNTIPDECECFADIDSTGTVDVYDLLTVTAQWGNTGSLGDVNFDGIVDVSDLLIVIGSWGPCE